MECSLAIKGVSSTKILQDLRNAFLRLTGLEFSLIDIKEKPFIVKQSIGQTCKALLASKKKDRAFLDFIGRSCDIITGSKKPVISEYEGMPLAFIPIIIENDIIGAALMCPSHGDEQSSGSVLSRQKIENASDLLAVFMKYIFKYEFDSLVLSDSDKQYSRNQEAVLKAVEFIKKNYHDKDISLQKVASEVGLSHYYFSHIFKNELKITFIEYLTKIRIEAAAKLLKNRNLNVNQIAYAVGYQDPNYFSKVFKRYMKISPIEYRNNLLRKGVEKQIITA